MDGFADVFKKLREEQGMSQQELANALKISKSTVNMYERGERRPKFEVLEAIADYFNVDTDFLLGRTNKTTKLITPRSHSYISSADDKSKEIQAIADQLESLNFRQEQLDRVMHYIKLLSKEDE